MKVTWTERAQQDVHEAFTYIALDKPDAAQRVVDRLTAAGTRLTLMPFKGRVSKAPNTREFAIPGLPYILIYEVGADELVIYRVMHGAPQR
jgi:toxin ParE1/3/4